MNQVEFNICNVLLSANNNQASIHFIVTELDMQGYPMKLNDLNVALFDCIANGYIAFDTFSKNYYLTQQGMMACQNFQMPYLYASQRAYQKAMDALLDNESKLNSTATPVNNYTCKLCKNDRCNNKEKSCWKCGELIPKLNEIKLSSFSKEDFLGYPK